MENLAEPLPIILVVAAALIDAQGRVLVQRRPPGKSLAGLWEFPGGKVESGETPERALVRELNEELGIALTPDDMIPFGFASAPIAPGHLVMLLYRVARWVGEPAPLHADAMQWAMPGSLAALPMPPADRPLVDLLMALPSPSSR